MSTPLSEAELDRIEGLIEQPHPNDPEYWCYSIEDDEVRQLIAGYRTLRTAHAAALETVRAVFELVRDYQDIPSTQFVEKYDPPTGTVTFVWLHDRIRELILVALGEGEVQE